MKGWIEALEVGRKFLGLPDDTKARLHFGKPTSDDQLAVGRMAKDVLRLLDADGENAENMERYARWADAVRGASGMLAAFDRVNRPETDFVAQVMTADLAAQLED